jgi:16S rRNA G966 N2-methylase RsmD
MSHDPIVWSSEKRMITELKPAVYNPRKSSEKEERDLSSSLERFSLADPIIINRNNTVIGGHFRLRILKQQGVRDVDVRVPDRLLTEAEEKELNLRLNRNLGEWDLEALGNFDIDFLKDVGFDTRELDIIFNSLEDEFDAARELERTTTNIQSGDLFELGNHRILCGDSTKEESYVRLLGVDLAQIIFTDPPYNVNYRSASGGSYAEGKFKHRPVFNDNLSEEYKHPTQKPVRLAERALRKNSERGEIVLDVFLGSGSTLIACEQLDRRCFGIELDPMYVQLIINRWEKFTRKKAVKL